MEKNKTKIEIDSLLWNAFLSSGKPGYYMLHNKIKKTTNK
jgi:hypothetical protein